MKRYVIDSSAWIEYFDGSPLGKRVAAIVEDPDAEIATCVISIAEMAAFYTAKNIEFPMIKKILISLSTMYAASFAFCEEAGMIYPQLRQKHPKISFFDVFVLLTARKLHAKVLTKDTDFAGIKDAEVLSD
ncbi:TPA: PIN domain-containing protein [Candidatus Woesearchaeota archaeon]|nr:PIN domain-containing protein [Candidatus Woesearchaeota archaeon]HIH47115.1 PIN domain-containing protein [Candidatus Woesearchaeota archaeon]